MKSNNIYDPRFAKWFFPLLVVGAAATLILTLCQILPKDSPAILKRGWLAFWTLAPALWFAIEYHWIFPTYKHPQATLADFKHGQEVSGKFWAAVVVLVGALALGKI